MRHRKILRQGIPEPVVSYTRGGTKIYTMNHKAIQAQLKEMNELFFTYPRIAKFLRRLKLL